ncbi:non-homologous end-joining DNA ligase [Methanoregula sp.]|uniref:non-homologous end-joining DNA ligase n=1 Tax=Methanoregula sp. TaxID=2052170 RepID=UPI003BAE995C
MPKNRESFQDLSKVRLTNLNKILYPAEGITKEEVITYYIRNAPRMLPFLHNRPLTMHRFPEGFGGEDFFEKDAPRGTPDYVEIFARWSETTQREVHFIVCNNLDTLIWIANLASLEIHIALSTTSAFETPDILLVDIDPEPPIPFDEVIDVAHVVREHLENEGIHPYVKTSGKKGLHIVVPLISGYRFGEVREFVHSIGRSISREIPHVVSEFPQSQDPGTIFIDYLQNAHGKTMVAPYSMRGSPEATVSTPLHWGDLVHGVRPEDFNIRTLNPAHEDPWRDIFENRQSIGKSAK